MLDVASHFVEDRGGGRLRMHAKGETDVAIEIAAPERRIVAGGEAEAGLREPTAKRAEHACLSDAGLTDCRAVSASTS